METANDAELALEIAALKEKNRKLEEENHKFALKLRAANR